MTTETIQPGSPAGAPSEVRSHLHGMWASVAGAWGEHAGYADERGGAITEELLDRAAIRSGDRVLELACGPGGAGLSAAARVGRTEVVLSDVAEQMTAMADQAGPRDHERARSCQGGSPDGRTTSCRREGSCCARPRGVTSEIRRVLRTDGRACAVWGPRERNPWLGVFDAVSGQIGRSAAGDTRPVLARRRQQGAVPAPRASPTSPSRNDTPLRTRSTSGGRTSSLAGPLADPRVLLTTRCTCCRSAVQST